MGWWITLGIIAIFYVLLRLSVTLYVAWGEQTEVAIGVAGFRKILLPEQTSKKKKPKTLKKKKLKTAKPKKVPKKESTEGFLQQMKELLCDGKEQSFAEMVTSLLALLSDFWTPIKRLLGAIRIEALEYELWVGASDAHQVALHYAAWSATFYNGLALLQRHMKIRCKRIQLNTDFTCEKIRQRGRMKVKLRLSTIFFYGFCLLWQVLKRLPRLLRSKRSSPKIASPS